MSGIRFQGCSKLAKRMTMTSQIVNKALLIFFTVVVFLLSGLVTGPSFMLLSLLVLVL